MYLIAIAWMYVVVMMSVAEATAPNGTVLGAIITFVLYGVLPCVILMYLMGTPLRRKAIRSKEKAELETLRRQMAQQTTDQATTMSPSLFPPDAGGETPTHAITPVREKP
jgi:mannose/fructose/N-acetylgalactosamine-specific phosphotransferase system component IID